MNTVSGLIELLFQKADLSASIWANRYSYRGSSLKVPPLPDETQTVSLNTPKGPLEFGLISMGNPHAVTIVDSIDTSDVASIGSAVQQLRQFSDSVNVGFMEIISESEIRLRVFERGVGENLACGTGACSAVTYGRLLGHLGPKVTVATRGGNLQIEWEGVGCDLKMTGPAESVFDGEFRL